MRSPFLEAVEAKKLLVLDLVLALVYFVMLLMFFQRGNPWLFWALIAGEVFHVWQLVALVHGVWEPRMRHEFAGGFFPPVDIYITVAGEPKNIVVRTVRAAMNIDYPDFNVYILNDGLVTKKPNWRDMEEVARQTGATCITRRRPGGAKAGNINHALRVTRSPFVAILDCDHIPEPDLLSRMMGYFGDDKVAFVQSPQYYRNNAKTYVANASWQQQTLFFGPICRGKDHFNSLFMCGTNAVIRRVALEDVGGMQQNSITEDLLTSLFMHARGWRSVYVPRILAEGLAPEDLGAYWQQQFRWARGSLEVMLKYNPLILRGLSGHQRVQYLASATFYLTGLVVLIDASLPLFYFFGGLIAVSSTTMALAMIFVPYIFLTLYTLQLVSNFAFSFRAIAFVLASWPIYTLALLATVLRIPSGFKITSKEKSSGNYLWLASVHIVYILAVVFGMGWALYRDGLTTSWVTNSSWAVLYVVLFVPFIRAAMSDRLAARIGYDELELPAEELIRE